MSDRWLDDLLASPSVWAEPGTDLEDTVVDAVAEASPVHAVPSVVTPLPQRAPRRRSTRRWVAGAATAAVAAIAVVVGVSVTRAEDHPAYTSNLSATALAPHAGAELEMYRSNAGFRVTLEAHGLPRLPAGQYYEAWLWSKTRTPVPVGTFSSSDGNVTLWSGVSAQGFPTATVTVEHADKDQSPSSRRVLAGRIRAT